MQAIGFLSRREHSRQELRAKLLDSLRKRVREEAALAAAAARATQELADALREQPSNGIDDAFVAPLAARLSASAPVVSAGLAVPALDGPSGSTGAACDARQGDSTQSARGIDTKSRAALATLRLANGTALPSRLMATLSAASRSGHSPKAVRVTTADLEAAESDRGELGPADPDADADATASLELTDPEAAVDQLLDWLAANKYLSEERFVESRVNTRSRKRGALLIKLELSRHGLALEPEQAAQLRETEFARAQALWQRKFGVVATDARLRARQARFLASRGFAAEVVRRIVGGQEES